jgi:hypothetical protein
VWVWVWWRISLGAPRRNNSARARYRPPALRFIRVPRRSSEVRDLYKKKKKSSLFFFIYFLILPHARWAKWWCTPSRDRSRYRSRWSSRPSCWRKTKLPPEVQVKVIKREKEGKKKQNNHTKPPPSDTHTHTHDALYRCRATWTRFNAPWPVGDPRPTFSTMSSFFLFYYFKRGKK